jgi:hypothetical protein
LRGRRLSSSVVFALSAQRSALTREPRSETPRISQICERGSAGAAPCWTAVLRATVEP